MQCHQSYISIYQITTITMNRSTSVCYSLNDLTSDAFDELDIEDNNLPTKSNLFNKVNSTIVLNIRAYSTGVYTFSYTNYRKNNISSLRRCRSTSTKK